MRDVSTALTYSHHCSHADLVIVYFTLEISPKSKQLKGVQHYPDMTLRTRDVNIQTGDFFPTIGIFLSLSVQESEGNIYLYCNFGTADEDGTIVPFTLPLDVVLSMPFPNQKLNRKSAVFDRILKEMPQVIATLYYSKVARGGLYLPNTSPSENRRGEAATVNQVPVPMVEAFPLMVVGSEGPIHSGYDGDTSANTEEANEDRLENETFHAYNQEHSQSGRLQLMTAFSETPKPKLSFQQFFDLTVDDENSVPSDGRNKKKKPKKPTRAEIVESPEKPHSSGRNNASRNRSSVNRYGFESDFSTAVKLSQAEKNQQKAQKQKETRDKNKKAKEDRLVSDAHTKAREGVAAMTAKLAERENTLKEASEDLEHRQRLWMLSTDASKPPDLRTVSDSSRTLPQSAASSSRHTEPQLPPPPPRVVTVHRTADANIDNAVVSYLTAFQSMLNAQTSQNNTSQNYMRDAFSVLATTTKDMISTKYGTTNNDKEV